MVTSLLRLGRYFQRQVIQPSAACRSYSSKSSESGEGHRPKYRRSRLTSWRVHDSLVLFPREKFVLWYTRVYPDYKSIPDVVTGGKLTKAYNILKVKLLTLALIYCFFLSFAGLQRFHEVQAKVKDMGTNVAEVASEAYYDAIRWERVKLEEAEAERRFEEEVRKFEQEEAEFLKANNKNIEE